MGLLRAIFDTRLLGSYLRLALAFLLAGLLTVVTLAVVDSFDDAFALIALITVGANPVLVGMTLLAIR